MKLWQRYLLKKSRNDLERRSKEYSKNSPNSIKNTMKRFKDERERQVNLTLCVPCHKEIHGNGL